MDLHSQVIKSLGLFGAVVGLSLSAPSWAQNAQAPQNSLSLPDAAVVASSGTAAKPLSQEEAQELNIPCPSFWTVQPNPSVENSLSYVHESGKIAVSVTYIAQKSGSLVSPNTFARVAAEQMNCTLPVKSNLLANGWAFNCDNNIEALVYGDTGDIVLLSISGRSDETENYLDNFITFLEYQARRR